MLKLPPWIDAHPQAARLGLAAWLALWALTCLTWLCDAAGRSFGMHPVLFILHLAAPAVVGARLGGRGGRAWPSTRGAILFSAASFAGLLVWSAALIGLGRVEPGPEVMPAWAGIGEAAGLGLAYLVWGGVWGWAGWLGAQLLRWLTRRPAK